MRLVWIRKACRTILIISLILLKSGESYCQSDSIQFWHDTLLNLKTKDKPFIICKKIEAYLIRSKDQTFLEDANLILKAAAKSDSAKQLFYILYNSLETISKKKKLETEYSLLSIRLESNADFQNEDIKNQLLYYYTQLYFRIKEYYNAEKYGKLYLSKGMHSFPDYVQADIDLNAMTIDALIDQDQNDFKSALAKLKVTLDSSISRKRTVWIGITKGNIAYILFQQGKYEESIPYLIEDVRVSLQFNELASAMNSYITLKDIYLKTNQPTIAYKYLDSAHFLLKKLLDLDPANADDLLVQGYQIHTSLGKMYFNQHDYIKASEFYNRAFHINLSIEQHDRESQIRQIIENIEIDRNLNNINELHEEVEKRKELLNFTIAIAVAIIGILIVYIIFYRHLKKANKSLIVKSEIIKHQNLVLEKINIDKDRLFSIISHDLRTPSNSLHAIFKAVSDKKLPASILEEQLPNIVKNSTNLINTLESLLTWSVSQLKGIVANKELLDINEAIIHNIQLFEDQANAKSIALINNCSSQMISFDKNHLEIILRNLTSNAIKFSKSNSTILFNQMEHADHIEISIVDQGTGLTENQIANILNKISIKSDVGTSGEKGIGLGLLLTKEFIEINGGVLKIKSKIKEGTTMSFTIPKEN
jgi:signal transduction histidine kinase